MKQFIKIGIIGDFDGREAHIATNAALQHAVDALGVRVDIVWIPTGNITDKKSTVMQGYDGIWCSPGSPYKSVSGALNGICFARENNIPFIGTCGGFQHAVLEYARDVLNIKELQNESFDPYLPNMIIIPLSCSLIGQIKSVLIPRDSYISQIYHQTEVAEKFNCSFGLSSDFVSQLEDGFEIQGRDEEKNPRILILKNHRFFVATLYQPQLSSSPEHPHPLIVEYLKKCIEAD